MYTFCSCDATMIPDVDHHQYFSFWDPWLQHYKRISRHTWTAFSSLTFICLLTCERAFFFDFFFYGSILMSERISGRHALRTSSQPRQHHTTSRSFALLDFLFGRPAFPGGYGTESATSLFLRAASLAALARCLAFFLLSCAWKSAQSCETPIYC